MKGLNRLVSRAASEFHHLINVIRGNAGLIHGSFLVISGFVIPLDFSKIRVFRVRRVFWVFITLVYELDLNIMWVFFGHGADLLTLLPSLVDYDLCRVCKDYSSLLCLLTIKNIHFPFFFFVKFDINFSSSLLFRNIDIFNPVGFSEDQSEKTHALVRFKVCCANTESAETPEYVILCDFS